MKKNRNYIDNETNEFVIENVSENYTERYPISEVAVLRGPVWHADGYTLKVHIGTRIQGRLSVFSTRPTSREECFAMFDKLTNHIAVQA